MEVNSETTHSNCALVAPSEPPDESASRIHSHRSEHQCICRENMLHNDMVLALQNVDEKSAKVGEENRRRPGIQWRAKVLHSHPHNPLIASRLGSCQHGAEWRPATPSLTRKLPGEHFIWTIHVQFFCTQGLADWPHIPHPDRWFYTPSNTHRVMIHDS